MFAAGAAAAEAAAAGAASARAGTSGVASCWQAVFCLLLSESALHRNGQLISDAGLWGLAYFV